MLVLAIDTSSAAVTAAVLDVAGGAVTLVSSRVTIDARAHGELLAPSIRDCLHKAGIGPAGLGAVVAGLGPGPFTGLRVGLVTAAVLADTRSVPAYGVCSLDAMAPDAGPVLVAGDARRREVYWARYLDGLRITGPDVSRPADLPFAELAGHSAAGAGARMYADVIGLPVTGPEYPDPVRLVELTADQIVAGAAGEVLVPLYLRRPDAVVPGSAKRAGR